MAAVDRDRAGLPDQKTIAAAIRASRLLDPVLKTRWLALLPHLRDEDRAELWSILSEGEQQLDQLDAPSDGPH